MAKDAAIPRSSSLAIALPMLPPKTTAGRSCSRAMISTRPTSVRRLAPADFAAPIAPAVAIGVPLGSDLIRYTKGERAVSFSEARSEKMPFLRHHLRWVHRGQRERRDDGGSARTIDFILPAFSPWADLADPAGPGLVDRSPGLEVFTNGTFAPGCPHPGGPDFPGRG